MSRPKTAVEIRTEFLTHLWFMIRYWSSEVSAECSTEDRIAGAVHSVLAALDGVAVGVPGTTISIKGATPAEIAEAKAEDRKWYPDVDDLHAGSMLHDEFYSVGRSLGYFK
jgi:hypothetical protein